MFETFSAKQNYTYDSVERLNQEILDNLDPTTFVLNNTVLALQEEIEKLQDDCDHIWDDGVCIVCGKIQD